MSRPLTALLTPIFKLTHLFVLAMLLVNCTGDANGQAGADTDVPARPSPTATNPQSAPIEATISSEVAPPSPTLAATHTPEPTLIPPGSSIVADHRSVELFEAIPDEYLVAAQALDMLFIDRSVGKNIDEALSCLAFSRDDQAPNHCTRLTHRDPAYNLDPSVVQWNRPGGYERSHWIFEFWPEGSCASWDEKIGCFLSRADEVVSQYDVISYQLSYLAVDAGSSIVDVPGGYFADNPDKMDVFDQEAFERRHPDTVFIYWTTSLARGIGTAVSDQFNQQMRQYAIDHGKPLFDVADILSHLPDGSPCYDNRDGRVYDNGNRTENHPDDGESYLAICPHYTTELDGGHLGSVSGGKIQVAKAFWVLMAQIAGWRP